MSYIVLDSNNVNKLTFIRPSHSTFLILFFPLRQPCTIQWVELAALFISLFERWRVPTWRSAFPSSDFRGFRKSYQANDFIY
jgi:hypothetical protein